MRTPLLALAPFLLSAPAAAVPLHGRVADKDGKPPVLAVVQVEPVSAHDVSFLDLDRPEDWNTPAVPVGADGTFTVELRAPGAWRVWFRAPEHRSLSTIVLLGGGERSLPPVTVALGRERRVPWLGTPSIVKKGDRIADAVAMKARADGTWELDQPAAGSQVLYSLELETAEQPVWAVNPGAPAVFDRSFYSVADVKDGRFTVRFDPKKLEPHGRDEGSVAWESPASLPARVAALTHDVEKAWHDAYLAQKAVPPSARSAIEGRARDQVVSSLLPVFRDPKAPRALREVAAVMLCGETLFTDAVSFVPPDSWAWSLMVPARDGDVVSPGFKDPGDAALTKMARTHPDKNVRGAALFALAHKARAAQHDAEATRLMQQVLQSYADAPTVKYGLLRDQRKRVRTVVGKPFPDLALETLDGRDVDAASMKGHDTLVEFSAYGCGACVALVPQLQKVREAYPPEKLRMVTITLGTTTKTLPELLRKQPPQPWEHVPLPDGDASYARLEAWEVSYYPTLFLVDGSGRIVAGDDELRRKKPLPEAIAPLVGRAADAGAGVNAPGPP